MKLLVLGSFVQACCWKVARLPLPGETLVATGLSIEAGGKGLNVALGSKRLAPQAQVDVMLGVGHDAAADALLQLLAAEGVGAQHVHKLAAQSGYGSGHIAADGQNAIAVFPGPNLLLTAQHADAAAATIQAADVVYGQFETSLAVLTRAFAIAKNGSPFKTPITVLNPSPWQPIPPELLVNVDVLVVNEVEAAHLLDMPIPLSGLSLEDAQVLIQTQLDSFWASASHPSTQRLVVTLGDQGSLAFESTSGATQLAAKVPAFPIQAVDTVGAGDAFASALCVALCQQTPMAEALTQANACGAIVAAQFGVLDALPTQAVVGEFLAKRE